MLILAASCVKTCLNAYFSCKTLGLILAVHKYCEVFLHLLNSDVALYAHTLVMPLDLSGMFFSVDCRLAMALFRKIH